MSSSVIVFVLVLVTGVVLIGWRRPPRQQPATLPVTTGRDANRTHHRLTLAAEQIDDERPGIIADSLRVLGLVRGDIEQPVVGINAYVRWWERVRAIAVLIAIIVVLGVLLAIAVGMTVLGLGFLLERAIG